MAVNLLTWNTTDSSKYASGVAQVAGVQLVYVHPRYPQRRTSGALRIRTRVGVPPSVDFTVIIGRITFQSLNATLVALGFPPG